jgi:hypothetical protein
VPAEEQYTSDTFDLPDADEYRSQYTERDCTHDSLHVVNEPSFHVYLIQEPLEHDRSTTGLVLDEQ